jgi:prepilin-type N-terminal cleavage/methylation domain-containing protein
MASTTFKQRLALQLLSKQRRLRASGAQGFTLIELLVVIVILGVLGAVGYGAYVNQIARANGNTAAVAATAMAKNCAALAATGDQSAFEPGVDGKNVVTNKAAGAAGCASGAFTVTAGVQNTNTQRTATATLNAVGAVIPATPPAP